VKLVPAVAALLWFISLPAAAKVRILAAENMYADIAAQVAGPAADTAAILSNPDQDPHEFEPSPSTARAVAGAAIVVYNGIGYDGWMERLLAASPNAAHTVIVVATLLGAKPGANPHLWYDPLAAPALARAVAAALVKVDPGAQAAIEGRLQRFLASLKPIDDKIAALKARYAGTEVAATEPVFGYMAAAIGLKVLEPGFALAVMNDTEPSIGDVASFERDLNSRRIKALIYNSQTTDTAVDRLRALAKRDNIPTVPVTETEPLRMNYQKWMLSELDALGTALSAALEDHTNSGRAPR